MPVGPLVSSFLKAGVIYVASELIFRAANQQEKLRDIALGVGLLIIAGSLAFMSLAGFLLAFFFYLAEINRFLNPALITSGITALLALLAGNESRRRFRA